MSDMQIHTWATEFICVKTDHARQHGVCPCTSHNEAVYHHTCQLYVTQQQQNSASGCCYFTAWVTEWMKYLKTYFGKNKNETRRPQCSELVMLREWFDWHLIILFFFTMNSSWPHLIIDKGWNYKLLSLYRVSYWDEKYFEEGLTTHCSIALQFPPQ